MEVSFISWVSSLWKRISSFRRRSRRTERAKRFLRSITERLCSIEMGVVIRWCRRWVGYSRPSTWFCETSFKIIIVVVVLKERCTKFILLFKSSSISLFFQFALSELLREAAHSRESIGRGRSYTHTVRYGDGGGGRFAWKDLDLPFPLFCQFFCMFF